MTKVVAVTGATGFVGKEVCRLLRDSGAEVRAFCGNNRDSGRSSGAIGLDLRADRHEWENALCDVDVVIHLAALTHERVDSGGYEELHSVNVIGTDNLVRAAVSAGVQRVVFMSSIKVNGEQTVKGCPFQACDPPSPVTDYGRTKLAAEQAVTEICEAHGVDWVVVRSPLVCGPGVKGNLADLARWAVKGWPLPFGAIKNSRSLISVTDLSGLISKCALTTRKLSSVFLASDDTTVSTALISRWIVAETRSDSWVLPIPPRFLSFLFRISGRSEMSIKLLGSLVVDNSDAKNSLGWRPVHGVEAAIRAMAAQVKSAKEEK
ncbi:NAD-dependent epimerase/dehydratase family protein [Marinobacter nauticus]|uniref:NAD-dependent epimerase/dehydratase family protein n=1 Tax=Marinobacter nauticus TaxID=2743 RepID=UPI001CFCA6DA|nr:NAD-dependent epimerase/dehydratase family protein [Marinobacter nauticus]